MRIIVYSAMNAETVISNFGEPEYSYYFVLREFMPILNEIGEVVNVRNPDVEVDMLYDEAISQGRDCYFLSFSPPHLTEKNLRCPTISVFAWEFSNIPNETWWEDKPEEDWQWSLNKLQGAIVHSQHTEAVVKQIMGNYFPVISAPAPLWNRLAPLREQGPSEESVLRRIVIDKGVVFDTHDKRIQKWMPTEEDIVRAVAEARGQLAIDEEKGFRRKRQNILAITSRYFKAWCRSVLVPSLPAALQERLSNRIYDPWKPGKCSVDLSGVVFTSLFNPHDGRKNWLDMITAFCTEFKDEPNATLVFKLGHHRYEDAIQGMLMVLPRLPSFKCRVILIHGYLDKTSYDALIQATQYVVNASYGEGQCLPLMEYMSCGKPAIAPRHTALADYIDEEVGFVVKSWSDSTTWPHDPRVAYRTLREQIDWQSLCLAYRQAYECFMNDRSHYQSLSAAAIRRLQAHCSLEKTKNSLVKFLKSLKVEECA